jgi:hypothetical protein
MSLVNFTNLDFDQIKSSIKDYLRANSNFTDYDFEGSNLSVLIDVLAYNTYITSYNANMVSNEVFIDAATLRENVVSLARNIGYVPRSKKCAAANVSFLVDVSALNTNPISITLKKGVVCTTATTFGNQNYSFAIVNDVTVPIVNQIANFTVDVCEGTYVTTTFTVDSNNPEQRFILPNTGIDSATIRVLVRDTETNTTARTFNLAESLFKVNSTSNVFFLQEIEDERYEIIFGDGIFGEKLQNLNYIEVSYIVTNGKDANGIDSFTFNGRLLDNNGNAVTSEISLITTNSPSGQGKDIESISSIKKYAPRIYASQNRAVTAADYEAIIPTVYPEAESVAVFGGETLDPPKYGKVFISIKPFNGDFVPETIKDNIKDLLRKYNVAGTVVDIVDLKYLYVEYQANAYFNVNKAPSADYVKAIIEENIANYADSVELNKYGARFKYSRFLNIIDTSHDSVTSNITRVQIRRDLRPVLNQFAQYEICYGNEFYVKNPNGYNIKTSGFISSGITDTVYISDLPDSDLKKGSLFLFKLEGQGNNIEPTILKRNVGTIDYVKGEIRLLPINILSTIKTKNQPIIEISAIPKSNDVIGLQDLYLQLDTTESSLNMVSDQVSSGSDPSGSTYIFSSSYINGDLVRL